jgi:CheY-like chemotaxis protein
MNAMINDINSFDEIKTILLVDDELIFRKVWQVHLETNGYHVISVGNGKEALESYIQNRDKISLVIMDLQMPVMSGTEAINEILKLDSDVKVLVSSVYLLDEKALDSKPKHFGYIRKPYRFSCLTTAIENILES